MHKSGNKITLDPFIFEQFEKGAEGYIEYDKVKFIEKINEDYNPSQLVDGYAPFCKHIFVKNFTPALIDYAEITPENEKLIKTKYEARRDKELPVLVRYFDQKDLPEQKAEYLDIILYSKEQIILERKALGEEDVNANLDYDYGIIGIKPQHVNYETPMIPITMMRNALGTEHGGSGVPLDRKCYQDSVDFWKKYCKIR